MDSLPDAASDAEKEKEKLKITGVTFWGGQQGSVFAGHWPSGAQLIVYKEKGHRLGRAGAKAKGQHTSFLFPVGSHKSQVLKS